MGEMGGRWGYRGGEEVEGWVVGRVCGRLGRVIGGGVLV